MALRHDEGWNSPPDAPFYPALPAVYRGVKLQMLFFQARPAAVEALLPEPLEALPDGACVVLGIEVPFCTSYGPFLEAVLQLKCRFRGKEGYYCSHVFHTGPAGIAAGREIYGTPKLFSELSVRYTDRAMVTTAGLGGVEIFKLSTFTPTVIPGDSAPSLSPSWRLKIIPRADGPGPALKQLIDASRAAQDQAIHFCAHGKGSLTFGSSPLLDLAPLEPVACGDAYYLETSFSESYAEIVYDYLAKATRTGTT